MTNESREEKSGEKQETFNSDFDLQLDDIEDEIIDLVDVIDEGDELAADSLLEEVPAADEEQPLFSLDDLDLDTELSDDFSSEEAVIEEVAQEEDSEVQLEIMGDQEIESHAEVQPTEVGDEDREASAGEESELEAEDALAELFESEEMDVSTLLAEASDPTGAEEQQAAGTIEEEGLPDEFFAELETEAASADEASDARESSWANEEISEDFLADLEIEEPALEQTTEPQELEAETTVAASSEELADLVKEQIEAVVTRVVEEKLPEVVQRIIREEIERLKATLE
ncbi:MAG: hypothetical protein JRI89_05670 [Deltaproteobacteria bacterium]|nr:hypothetical protein [Deltaproteobacteria bacterium]